MGEVEKRKNISNRYRDTLLETRNHPHTLMKSSKQEGKAGTIDVSITDEADGDVVSGGGHRIGPFGATVSPHGRV